MVGNNVINVGSDTAGYVDVDSAAKVSLALQGSAQNTIAAGMDTLPKIDSRDGTLFNDTLTGDAGTNVLADLDGNYNLVGAARADTLTAELATTRWTAAWATMS